MAAKKLFTQIFSYFYKSLRLLYSLIIYEIVNFSFFALYSLLLLSFFLYLKSVPIYVIIHVYTPGSIIKRTTPLVESVFCDQRYCCQRTCEFRTHYNPT